MVKSMIIFPVGNLSNLSNESRGSSWVGVFYNTERSRKPQICSMDNLEEECWMGRKIFLLETSFKCPLCHNLWITLDSTLSSTHRAEWKFGNGILHITHTCLLLSFITAVHFHAYFVILFLWITKVIFRLFQLSLCLPGSNSKVRCSR